MMAAECTHTLICSERKPLTVWFVASCVVHAALVVTVFISAGQKISHIPPAQIIQVDLGSVAERRPPASRMEPVQRKTAGPVLRPVPLPEPAAVSQPQLQRPVTPPAAAEKQTAKAPVSPSFNAPRQLVTAADPVPAAKTEHSTGAPAVQGGGMPGGSQQKSKAGDNAARTNYFAVVRTAIENRKEYPLLARRKKLEGTVLVRFVLSRSGRLQSAEIATPSHESILDNAALQAVKAVPSFPAAPAEISGESIKVEIPLEFRLLNR